MAVVEADHNLNLTALEGNYEKRAWLATSSTYCDCLLIVWNTLSCLQGKHVLSLYRKGEGLYFSLGIY